MPYKDPEQRRQRMIGWREARTPEYNRWLYRRRAFRFWKAEKLEEVLVVIATGKHKGTPKEVARVWLDEILDSEKDIGNRFDHDQNVGFYDPDFRQSQQGDLDWQRDDRS